MQHTKDSSIGYNYLAHVDYSIEAWLGTQDEWQLRNSASKNNCEYKLSNALHQEIQWAS